MSISHNRDPPDSRPNPKNCYNRSKGVTTYAIEEHFKDDEKNSHNVFLEIVEDMTKIYKM